MGQLVLHKKDNLILSNIPNLAYVFSTSQRVWYVTFYVALFKTWHAVKIVLPQKCIGESDSINMAFANSIRVLFFLPATPLEAGEYGAIVL